MSSEASSAEPQSNGRLAATSLAALGVVFGDIGTSPLYTLKTVLDYTGPHPDPSATLGALSLILWTLFLITTVKYVSFAMRVDNDGEGGIIALMTLLGVKQQSAADHHRGRIVRRGAHLWRRRDHAGDFGALRARRRGTDRAGIDDLCVAGRDLILLALFAVQPFGTAAIGRAFGPIMLAWFLIIAALGLYGIVQHPAVYCRDQSALRPRLSGAGRHAGLSRARRRVPVRHRRRGALRRHGAFRRRADPPVLERHRLSGAHPQLRRPGGDRAGGRADRGQHLLSALPWAAADAADPARDGRDRHRQPVDHHRRLFDDAPGDPARLAAAHDHQADLGGGLRPDLCRHGELAFDDRDPRPHDRLRQVRQSCRRLRHRGVGDDADDERASLHRHARNLELAGLGGGRGRGPVHHHRLQLLRRQHGQGAWTAAGSRCCWLPSSTA